MSTWHEFFNMTELVGAATAKALTVHLHIVNEGAPGFLIGNAALRSIEFQDYDDAMAYVLALPTLDAGYSLDPEGELITLPKSGKHPWLKVATNV